jgi:hypothetical protein
MIIFESARLRFRAGSWQRPAVAPEKRSYGGQAVGSGSLSITRSLHTMHIFHNAPDLTANGKRMAVAAAAAAIFMQQGNSSDFNAMDSVATGPGQGLSSLISRKFATH